MYGSMRLVVGVGLDVVGGFAACGLGLSRRGKSEDR